jgi:hypothetical protein
MIEIGKEEVLLGLKRFKRLAKQDILASSLTSEPEFWREQAEARREEYTNLMNIVESDGVEAACDKALKMHAALPHFDSNTKVDPVLSGKKQALSMFLTIVGIQPAVVNDANSLVEETMTSTIPQMENEGVSV